MTPQDAQTGAFAEAPEPEGPWAQSTVLAFRFLFVAVLIAAVGWALSNCRRVAPDSQALVLRFGKIVRAQGPGLLLAWPNPIDQVAELPAAQQLLQQRIARFDLAPPQSASDRAAAVLAAHAGLVPAKPAGAAADVSVGADPRGNAGFLLTGDFNVVHLQADLVYQVSDPVAYFIAGPHVAPALDRLFVASAVAVCAQRGLDAILVTQAGGSAATVTEGREQFRGDLVREVNRRLADLAASGAGLGIRVNRVDIATALPAGVKADFDRVLTVTQSEERNIADARTYAESTTQEALREAETVQTDADAAAAEKLAAAHTRTANVAALEASAEGSFGPALLAKIYHERIGAVLAKAKRVDAVDPHGSARLVLPGASP
jgi:regulator of protease activity HflC (stomatin/prohibitin superfamily)